MLLKFPSRYPVKVFTLFAALTVSGICTYSQNLIGYKYMEIRNFMNENYKEMSYNNVSNSKYKYLKYSDRSDSQTLLFFLNSDSVCTSVRMICDITIKEKKAKEFNSVYKKKGDNRWLETRNGNHYIIKIKDEEWYYTITMEPDK